MAKLKENEIEQRNIFIKGLLKNKSSLVKKYGRDAERVMYGIATKNSKKKIQKMKDMKRELIKELIKNSLQSKIKTKRLNEDDKNDIISMDVPFLIRMLEYSKEEAKDDIELHKITTNMINISNKESRALNMSDYENIVGSKKEKIEKNNKKIIKIYKKF